MRKRNYDFCKNSKWFVICIAAVYVLTIAMAFINGIGVDIKFTGGALLKYSYTGGTASSYSGNAGSAEMIGTLLNAFLGGNVGSVSGLTGANTNFLYGRALSTEDTVAYIENNFFDAGALVWTENANGEQVIRLAEDQW